MWLRQRAIHIVLLASTWGACASPALADGKFFRRPEIVDEPGIVAQRAVVAWRDGVETLIVQSDVEAAGESFGWVLPLPAEPTSIEPCSVNTLQALTTVVGPEFAMSYTGPSVIALVILAFAVAGSLDHLRATRQEKVAASLVRIAMAAGVLLIIGLMLLPALGSARNLGGFGAAAQVLQTQRAGVYDVSIIKGDTGDAVQAWLKEHGFACPASAAPVLKAYAAEGWCFLTAKIVPEATGEVSHHPLRVAFRVPQPVYPMKLTGSDGEPVQLDLFVIGEQRAAVAGLRTWVSDTFEPGEHYHPFKKCAEYACTIPTSYRATRYRSERIGIPVVSELMWPGCVVTRLRGRLSAGQMRDDLAINWRAPEPTRAIVFSRSDALGWSGSAAAVVCALALVWFARGAARRRWSPVGLLGRRLPVAALIGLLGGGVVYAALDVVPTRELGGRGFWRNMMVWRLHRPFLGGDPAEWPDGPFPDVYRGIMVEAWEREPVTNLLQLSEPGDYHIAERDDGWALTILDGWYVPITIAIAPDGTPREAEDQ